MPIITPVSELRNYGQVLEKVKPNAPVYLTKNGRGKFSVHSIEDDDEFDLENSFEYTDDDNNNSYNNYPDNSTSNNMTQKEMRFYNYSRWKYACYFN